MGFPQPARLAPADDLWTSAARVFHPPEAREKPTVVPKAGPQAKVKKNKD
jgi:hypothetical protein